MNTIWDTEEWKSIMTASSCIVNEKVAFEAIYNFFSKHSDKITFADIERKFRESNSCKYYLLARDAEKKNPLRADWSISKYFVELKTGFETRKEAIVDVNDQSYHQSANLLRLAEAGVCSPERTKIKEDALLIFSDILIKEPKLTKIESEELFSAFLFHVKEHVGVWGTLEEGKVMVVCGDRILVSPNKEPVISSQ